MAYSVKDALEDRKRNNLSIPVQDALKYREEYKKQNSDKIATDLYDRYNSTVDLYNEYIDSFSPTWGADLRDTLDNQRDLQNNANKLIKDLRANYNYLDKTSTDKMIESLENINKGYKSVLEQQQFYSSFESEEAYNKELEQYKSYLDAEQRKDELRKVDLDALGKEIDDLSYLKKWGVNKPAMMTEKEWGERIGKNQDPLSKNRLTYEDYVRNYNTQFPLDTSVDRYTPIEDYGYSSKGEVSNALADKKLLYDNAKKLQDFERLTESALKAEDYAVYSQIGANFNNPTYDEGTGALFSKKKPINNIVTWSRDNLDALALAEAEGVMTPGKWKYQFMDDDEVGIYNYYLAKENAGEVAPGTAQRYLDTLEDSLTYRQANERFNRNLKDKAGLEILFGIEAGINQFATGMQKIPNMLNAESTSSPNVVTYMSGMAREDLADVGFKVLGNSLGQMAYDAVTTTANMLPTIGASYLANFILPGSGEFVGTALMGASAAGNTYDELINSGMNYDQARAFSIVSGAWEGLSEHYLGSIEGLAGGKIKELTGGISNALLRFFADNAVEGMEEVIQDLGESVIKGVMQGEWEFSNLEEQAYNFTLGFLSSAMLGGPGEVANKFVTDSKYKSVYSQDQSKLVQQGLESENEKVKGLASKYQAILDKNKNLSGSQLRKLVDSQTNDMFTKDTGKIKSAVSERLKTLGETTDIDTLSSAISKVVANNRVEDLNKGTISGEVLNEIRLTKAEKNALENGKFTEIILSELDPNNFKNGVGLTTSDWTEKILTDLVNPMEYGGAKRINEVMQKTIEDSVKEAKLGVNTKDVEKMVSEDGKTTLINSDTPVEIIKIKSIDNGKMTLELSDGKNVNSHDVKYSTEDEALVYETILNQGYNVETANAIINAYKSNNGIKASNFLLGFQEAFNYGTIGYPLDEIKGNTFIDNLPDSLKKFAYNLGLKDKTERAKSNTTARYAKNEGGVVHVLDSAMNVLIDEKATSKATGETRIRKEQINYVRQLAKDVLKTDVYLYASKENKLQENIGNRIAGNIAPNGFFDRNTGAIWLDVNAGNRGEGTLLWTLGHEVTHFIKEYSSSAFDRLADAVMMEYLAEGADIEGLIARKIANAKEKGVTLNYADAYEDVVADTMQKMFTDYDAATKILDNVIAGDKTFLQKVKALIDKLLNKVKEFYSHLILGTPEAIYTQKMVDALERLSQYYAEGVASAVKNFTQISETKSIQYSKMESKTKGAKSTNGGNLFQFRAMENDIPEYRKMLRDVGVSEKEIDKLFGIVDSVMTKIKENLEILDYDWELDINDRSFNPVKPNSDTLYKNSIDFSTLCRKRILQQMVQMQLQEALDRAITREESIAIRDELKKIQQEGREIEIACALCYVESARMKSPAQIKKFLDNRREVITDFFASKGDIKDKILNAEISARERLAEKYADEIASGKYKNPASFTLNKKGNKTYISLKALPKTIADEIRAAKKSAKKSYVLTEEQKHLLDVADSLSTSEWTSPDGLSNLAKKYPDLFDAYTSFVRNATKSKGLEKDVWWRAGDSRAMTNDLIASMNKENGLRSQSWSDFQVIHTLDYIAAIIELSTRNAKMQAYTKVADYVKLMGNTNQMINLSLIPTAVFKGILEYDSVEGMPFETALELRDKYASTVGTICIGITDEQIKMLLDSDLIDYVIPYHHSGMSAVIRKVMDIPTWTSYESYQHEDPLNGNDAINNAKKYGATLLSESDPNWHKALNFSDWFDYKKAQSIANEYNKKPTSQLTAKEKEIKKKYGKMFGGYMAMQSMADNYKRICAERGLSPKFSKGTTDFSMEENYWKVLIDRKMINNKTGEIIEQKAVKPIFNEEDILEILDDEIARYPRVKADQEYATREVVRRFLSGEMDNEINAIEKVTGAVKKSVDNVTKVSILSSENTQSDVKNSDRGNGYDGRSMSNNARAAYREGEKPLSRWTKSDIIDELELINENVDFGKMTTQALKDTFLKKSSWHHTGAFYNSTDFYSFDSAKAEKITQNEVDSIVDKYKNMPKVVRVERDKTLDAEIEGISKKVDILSAMAISGVKTRKGWINRILAGKDIEAEYQKALKKISIEDRAKVEQWRKLPKDHWRQEYVNLFDNDIEEYARRMYANNTLSKNTNEFKSLFKYMSSNDNVSFSDRVTDDNTLDFLNEQIARGEYDPETNPNGGYYVTYKSMSFWGYDDEGRPILRSPMAEYVDRKLSNAYIIPKKGEDLNWYVSTESIDPKTGMPKGLLVKIKGENEEYKYLSAAKNPKLIKEDWSNLYFKLKKKVKGEDSSVYARYNPYEHSSNLMLNDQFASAYKRDNLVTVKMFVPVSEDNGTFRAKYSKDPTGWTEWKSGVVATGISEAKEDFQRNVYLSRYAAPVEIIPNKEVAKAYKEYTEGTNVYVPWNVVSPNLREELVKAGVKVSYNNVTFGKKVASFNEEFPGARFSDRYDEEVNLDNRTLLANALSDAARTNAEKKLLGDYRKQAKQINTEEEKLKRLRSDLKDLYFSKGKRDFGKINATKEEITKTENRINLLDKKLLRIESMQPVKDIIDREKKKAYSLAESKGQDALAEYRKQSMITLREVKDKYRERIAKGVESRNANYYKTRIVKIVNDLTERLLHPSAKTAIPIAFGKSVSKFLSLIDLRTFDNDGNVRGGEANANRVAVRNALTDLAKELQANTLDELYGQLDIAPEMLDWITEVATAFDLLLKRFGEITINKMDSEQLSILYKFLKSLNTSINQVGKLYTIKSSDVEDLAKNTMDYLKPLTERSHNVILEKMGKTFKWDYAAPVTVFDRFGEGGRIIFNSFVGGQSKMAFNMQILKEYVDVGYTEKEAKSWQEDIVEVTIKGKKYQMTPGMLMSFYELMKQSDSHRHIIQGGGIRLADVKVGSQTNRYTNTFITEEEALQIESLLTDRQKEVADWMQKIMATQGADWGNEISMIRFGYKAFTNPEYFPIRTIAAGSEYEAQQKRANIYALLNKSFTKERNINANNAVIVDDIFTVFANHMSEMALYNAWALPVIDAIKWFNYKIPQNIDEETSEQSMHETLRLAYGNAADEYIRRLLESINSQKSNGLSEDVAFFNLRMMNRVAVAANVRVAIQQPFSITRAFELINPKYCVPLVGKAYTEAYNEMLANSGMALWKSMGYFDVDVSRPFDVEVKKNASFVDKVTEKSMILAEMGDNFTWATLWNACKKETKEKNPKVSKEELLQKTTDRFNDIIVRTQVVDSVLTKNQWMRDGSFFHRSTSAFMSEPMTSYNTLLRQYDKWARDSIVYGKKQAAVRNAKAMAITVAVFSLTQLVNAIVTAPLDAMRDDDDYETFLEKMLDKFKGNFIENMIPTSMMPYLSDVAEYLIYGKTDRPDLQLWTKAIDFGKSVVNIFDNYSVTKLHKLSMAALSLGSSFSGLPVSNVVRDVIAIWNTIAGNIGNGELKFQTSEDKSSVAYEKMFDALRRGDDRRIVNLYSQLISNTIEPDAIFSGVEKHIKNAYIDGEISEDDAREYLKILAELTHKKVEEDDLVWKFDRWNYESENGTDKEYSKYGNFYEAVESGQNLRSVINEYKAKGVDEKTLASQITSHFKPIYLSMTKLERAKLKGYLLNAYAMLGYDRTKKSKDIDNWS